MSPRVARRLGLSCLSAASMAALGCSDILGIEERRYDPERSVCDLYCAEVMDTCAGDFKLYASLESCLGTCGHLPEGNEGDQAINTVQCRRAQAQLARQTGELAQYCRRAGPGGNGVCGTNCEGYCSLMVPVCGFDGYESADACLAACAPLPDRQDYHVPTPDDDSVQCRLYHVTSAVLSPEHCAHAAGATKCVAQAAPDAGPDAPGAPPDEPDSGGR